MTLDLTNFIKVYEKEIYLPKINDKDIYIYTIDQYNHYIYDINNIVVNNRFIDRFWYNNVNKTVYQDLNLRFTKYTCDVIMYPLLGNIDIESLDILRIQNNDNYIYYFMHNRYKLANFIGILTKTNGLYYMVYYANKVILKFILDNKPCHKSYLLLDILYNNNSDIMNINLLRQLNNILIKTPGKKQNYTNFEFLKENIKLYNYQKNDIEWMSNIKNNIDSNNNNIELVYNDYHQVILDNIEYVMFDKTLLQNININAIKDSICIVKYYGGNIITEIGLGKTLIVLTYLLKHSINNYDQYVNFDNISCNYFYKRGKNKGKSCIKNKNNDLYCSEHSKTLFIDKRKNLNNLNNFSLRDTVITKNNKYYFKSNANLIICPNQLADQWVREYYEKFKQDQLYSKRVLLIVTYDQYSNLTFSDILFADIIVVSYNFLLNTNYNKIKSRNIIDILNEINKKPQNSILNTMNVFNPELNILTNFYYNHIIIDEYHEAIGSKLIEQICSLQSIYKWNISATPFAHGKQSFINGVNYVTNLNKDFSRLISCKSIENFDILYRRNTRESIKDDYTSNILTNNLKLLNFTDQERRIYDAHSINKSLSYRNFLIKLCCDCSIDDGTRSLVKNCKSLEEIENVILNFNKKNLCRLKKKIDKSKMQIDELLNVIEMPIGAGYQFEDEFFATIDEIKLELSSCRRRLTNQKKEYDDIYRTYSYLKNAIDNIKITETCPICLDDIIVDSIAITKCGHKFCKECIHEYVEHIRGNPKCPKCPKCNIVIKLDEIYLLEEKNYVEQTDLNNLIQKIKSTKIGNIIYYIKNKLEAGDKCIIFSQWNEMLIKVANFLISENIKTVFCTGTVYQRKKSIMSFQNDPKINVICLSSVNSASGINLTAANKIIFIEPIYGTKEYRKDIENQGIGRSMRLNQTRPIEIIRFIIKDTIEEEIYNDNKIEEINMLQNVDFD